MEQELPLVGACLRCGCPCKTGKPDPKARAIRKSATVGLCPNCMITCLLCSVEPLERTIAEKGPELLFGGGNDAFHQSLRQCVSNVLSHTQMREDEIDWIEVVGNWGLPWPKGHKPDSRWL